MSGKAIIPVALLLTLLSSWAVVVANAQTPPSYYIGVLTTVPFNPGAQVGAAAQLAANEINAMDSSSTMFPGKNFTINLILNSTFSLPNLAAAVTYKMITGTWNVIPNTNLKGVVTAGLESKRAIGIIGDLTSAASQSAAAVAGFMQVPQISYGSGSDALSDKQTYPYFCRVVPSDLSQAYVMLQTCQAFGWHKVAIIGSSDVWGNALAQSLQSLADRHSVRVLAYRSIPLNDAFAAPFGTGGANIRRVLEEVRATGARIILLLMWLPDGQMALRDAYDMGMAGPGTRYQYFLANLAATDDTFFSANGTATLGASEMPKVRAAGRGALASRAKAATPEFHTQWAGVQAGLETQLKYAPGFLNLTYNYSAFAYEAVYTFAHAIHNVTKFGVSPTDGFALLNAIKGVNYTGTTGPVLLGKADCNRAPIYEILNAKGTATSVFFKRVSTWLALNTSNVVGAITAEAQVIWPDGPGAPPADEYRPLNELSWQTKGGILAIMITVILLAGATSYGVYYFRDEEYMRATSPGLAHLTMFGTVVGTISVICFVISTSAFVKCHFSLFLILACFSLTFGTLAARTWRIDKLFNQQVLRKVTIRDYHLFGVLAGLMAYDFIAVMAHWAEAPATIGRAPELADSTSDVEICLYDNGVTLLLIVGIPKAALTLYSVWLAYKVRNVSYNFNESKSIAFAVAIEFFILMASLPLWLALDNSPEAANWSFAGGMACSMLAVLSIIFWPRFLFILERKRLIKLHGGVGFVSKGNETYVGDEEEVAAAEDKEKIAVGVDQKPEAGFNMKTSTIVEDTTAGASNPSNPSNPSHPSNHSSNGDSNRPPSVPGSRRSAVPLTSTCQNCGMVVVAPQYNTTRLDDVAGALQKSMNRSRSTATPPSNYNPSNRPTSMLGYNLSRTSAARPTSAISADSPMGAGAASSPAPASRPSSGIDLKYFIPKFLTSKKSNSLQMTNAAPPEPSDGASADGGQKPQDWPSCLGEYATGALEYESSESPPSPASSSMPAVRPTRTYLLLPSPGKHAVNADVPLTSIHVDGGGAQFGQPQGADDGFELQSAPHAGTTETVAGQAASSSDS